MRARVGSGGRRQKCTLVGRMRERGVQKEMGKEGAPSNTHTGRGVRGRERGPRCSAVCGDGGGNVTGVAWGMGARGGGVCSAPPSSVLQINSTLAAVP